MSAQTQEYDNRNVSVCEHFEANWINITLNLQLDFYFQYLHEMVKCLITMSLSVFTSKSDTKLRIDDKIWSKYL